MVFPSDFVEVNVVVSEMQNISVTVSAPYYRTATSMRLFDYSGLAAHVLISAAGVDGDLLVFSNGDSLSCSAVAYLQADSQAYSSWPAGVLATLLFSVGADGTVGVPSISGIPMQRLSTNTTGCAPARFSSQELLDGAFFTPQRHI
jgi:hypothetical protein